MERLVLTRADFGRGLSRSHPRPERNCVPLLRRELVRDFAELFPCTTINIICEKATGRRP
jgi:hypothetical protein